MSKQKIVARVYDKKGRLLATGHNSYTKTHPRQAHFARLAGTERKTYLHAEIAAIVRCRYGIPYSIRVERRKANQSLALAKPCSVCMLAIKEAGIKEISYTIG
jgi:tRNA(Arg) A34 adenosine deaminase TadA